METFEKNSSGYIGKAIVSYGISINILYEKKGIHLDRHKVEYIPRDSNMKKDKHLIGTDSTERILSILKEKNYDHMVLYHSESRNGMFNETNSEDKIIQCLQFPEDEEKDIDTQQERS